MRTRLVLGLTVLFLLFGCATKQPPPVDPVGLHPSLDADLRPYLGVMLWEDCEHEPWPHTWVRMSIDSIQLAGVTEDGQLWVTPAFIRNVRHEQAHLRQAQQHGCRVLREAKRTNSALVDKLEADARAAEEVVRNRPER